jgi:uncharacterized membrane protein (UPF0127 family)
MRKYVVAVLMVAVGFANADTAAARPASAAPVVAACANPALPQAILDGPSPSRTTWMLPLPVVPVSGARMPLTLAVASDERSRELGLMCVTRLRAHRGMIFVFDAPEQQEFWMKNTLVPLDMVWVDANGRVTTVAGHVPASTRATPDSEVARRTGFGSYVIELRAGEAEADGIVPGLHFVLGTLNIKQ